ncbi:MAG: hypothetical protein LBV71_18295 [Prevotella sp.]|jgi:hypothetical protein|nr:hypothetical protein [Prevotella sp.]
MDTRILPKAIIEKYAPLNIEDVNNKDASIKVDKDKMIIGMGSWRQSFPILWMPVALALFAMIISCWCVWGMLYKYDTDPEIYIHIVDNNLEPTEKDIKEGYDEHTANIYKRIKLRDGDVEGKEYLYSILKSNKYTIINPPITVIIFSALFLLGAVGLLYIVNMFSTVMILNREKGTFTVSRYFGQRLVTADFTDDEQLIFRLVSTFRFGQNLSLSVRFVKANYEYDTNISEVNMFLSLFTHYMDRNRPLPEGTAFDQYRQEDYERRKSEGFPKPLFRSVIPMIDVDGDTKRYRKG